MKTETADANIHIRVRPEEREMIDRAARLRGMNRSQFIMAAATKEAANAVFDNSVIRMSGEDFDAFMHALDHPAGPNEKLKALLSTPPVWAGS